MSYQLRAKSDTWFTRTPAPAAGLDNHQKEFITAGKTFTIAAYLLQDDYLKITLGRATNGQQIAIRGYNTWYLHKTTVEVLENGQVIALEPQHAPPKATPTPTNTPSGSIPQKGIELIKEFEGYAQKLPDGRAQAYADPIHGWKVPTIGYGTTKYPDGRSVQQGDIITHAEAEAYLIAHIEHSTRAAMERIPTWNQMNDNQQGAIYSFAYNLGAGFYKNRGFESITRVCDSPDRWLDKAWIKEQFVKYRNPGTSAEAGLRRRREAEATLFCA
ncbi:MAG: lysozyme [Cyanothece sp. SIO2G6]|nr:lysozyme [Cyanothece sp. SIO2G6]